MAYRCAIGHWPILICHFFWFLLFFVLLQTRREIIDIGILALVLVLGTENLTGELLFECLFTALGFEPLGAVASRFGIGTKILPGRTIAARIYRSRIGELGVAAAHGRAAGPRRRKPGTEPAWGAWTGLPGSRFVDGEWPPFEGLVVELANGFL